MIFGLKKVAALVAAAAIAVSLAPSSIADSGEEWYLAEEVVFDTAEPDAEDRYSIRYDNADNLAEITAGAEDGLTITQTADVDLTTGYDDKRPEVTVDFTDLIGDTGKYYIELTFKGAATGKGKFRMEFKAQDITKEAARFSIVNTYEEGYMETNAKNSAGSRVDLSRLEKIVYEQGTEKTVGLLYDMDTKTFRYVDEHNVHDGVYSNNWGSGLGGMWISCQGAAVGDYINLISAKLYKYGENPAGADDAYSVESDMADVTLESLTGSADGTVTDDIALPLKGNMGSSISWQSSDTGVIANDGKVTRPEDSDRHVTLTASFTKGSVSETKLFEVTVLKKTVEYEPEIIKTGNLALNKTASSNSVIGNYGPELAVDGKGSSAGDTSRLATEDNVDNAGKWLMVDFGEPTSFNTVRIDQWFSRIRKYKIQYSNDGETWKDTSIGEVESDKPYVNSRPHTQIDVPKFDPVTARYVRILFTYNEPGDSGISIFEFEVYNDLEYTYEKFTEDVSALTLESILGGNTSSDSITENLAELPLGLPNGASVVWKSSDENIISSEGRVTSDTFEDKAVTLTAAISSPLKTMTQEIEFDFTVKRKNSDELKEIFQKDINSLSDKIILKDNKSFDYVISELELVTELDGKTSVRWESSDDTVVNSQTGTVTRPSDNDRSVILTAVFTLDTLTYEKKYNITVKRQADNAAEDVFLSECSAVKEESYLGANSDKDNIKFDLNLPISPLPSGVEIVWTSGNSDVISNEGVVTRGGKDETVELTAEISMKNGGEVLFSDTRTLVYTVKAAEAEALWRLSDSVKFDNADGTSNYYFGSYNTDKGDITLEKNGIKISQATESGFKDDTERPSVNIDLSEHIEAGKTYYIRFSYTAYMRTGSTRIYMNNASGGEAALMEIKSGDGSVISAAAKTSSGNREWIDSKLGMKHCQNTEESLGLIYDTGSDSFRFVQNDAVVSETAYSNSYGNGLGSIRLSFQGADNGQGSYVILRGVDVYEYDAALMTAVTEAADNIDTALITDQDAELIYKDFNSLPQTGLNDTKITWISSDSSVISNTGDVTRAETDRNVTLTAVIERSGCTMEKKFEFVVIGSANKDAELEIDKRRIIKAAAAIGLSADGTSDISGNIDMTALVYESEFGNDISYISSDESVLDGNGNVVRDPENDREVSLICSVNGEKLVEFKLNVKASGNVIDGNLAEGAAVSSSSKFADGCGPEKAVDTRYTTKWFTSGSPKEPYITLDLGSEQLVAAVTLYEAESESGYAVKKAKIETSADGKNYTQAAELNGIGKELTVVFAPVKARYIRYTVTEKDGGDTGLYEFIVKYAPNDEDVVSADKESFVWQYEYVVTDDLELPDAGEYGSEITWSSSDTSLISNDGKVTRPQRENSIGNKVTLTAVFAYGEAETELQIMCKVKALSSGGTGGSGGSSGGGSGSSGGSSGGVTAGIYGNNNTPLPTPEPQAEIFSDVGRDRWSYDYIKTLYDKGVVNGDGGKFYPERSITREELVKLVVEALGMEPETGNTGFDDVDSGAWYGKYIYTAKKNGIINGISDEHFGVGAPVTRQDMAVIIYRAVSLSGADFENLGIADGFSDKDLISDYAYEVVDAMASAGIINGLEDGRFAPFDSASREQCTKVICLSIENL